jgi:hypothetical protein
MSDMSEQSSSDSSNEYGNQNVIGTPIIGVSSFNLLASINNS